MKSIGFIDLYINEWHANNYPAWIKEANNELGYDYKVQYAWAEQFVVPGDNKNTDEWCKEMSVTRCQTIEELCEKSDVILILSPSNPEKHLEYAKIVLPYGKPTYIDKPFSDTAENAKEIFALAEKYNTKFFSSSALRYASEISDTDEYVGITTLGGGGSVEEYIIHQAEMIVKTIGVGATKIKSQKITDSQYTFTLEYNDSRKAGMHFAKGLAPFAVILDKGDGSYTDYKVVQSEFFKTLIKDILVFFENGNISFDVKEILEVNKIQVAAIKAKAAPDEWINI